MRTKEQLETELTSLQTVIDGLSKQGAKLGHVMSTLRRSMPDLTGRLLKLSRYYTKVRSMYMYSLSGTNTVLNFKKL